MPKPAQRPYQPKTHKIEREYGRQLRKIARHIGDIIGAFPAGDPSSVPPIQRALDDYSRVIDGWARLTAGKMLSGVLREDDAAWRARSNEMSAELQYELQHAPTGALMRALLEDQVTLIKSIPLDAAQRVHDWTLAGIEDGTRAREVAVAIQNSTGVASNRAMLIARTETARTASKLTEARALHVGSDGYIWRSSRDSDVRHSHRAMEGKYVRWDAPPHFDDGGGSYHAGNIWNCRCYAEPVIPD